MPRYLSPRLLTAADKLSNFESRSTEQSDWLKNHAAQSSAAGATRVFAVTTASEHEVVAYYAWRMAQIQISEAPQRLTKGTGRYPQPVALLVRLAVHIRHEQRGIGTAMLADAITRLVTLDPQIGCRGLLIHAENDEARAFYLHVLPELLASPTDPDHLVLLMKDARRTLLGG